MKWNFPICIGALDGKHIVIKAPPNTGSDFFNYKKNYSIILLACVDHDYCFTYIDIGAKGRDSDGGVFDHFPLKTAINNNALNIPERYVFVADAAFPLKNYLMKPYPGHDLTVAEKIYNYRLSRARRIVENAFGILASRFQNFGKHINLNIKNTKKVVKTCCCLHNWLRKTSPAHAHFAYSNTWRSNFLSFVEENNMDCSEARQKRNALRDYFNSDTGAVSWQTNCLQ